MLPSLVSGGGAPGKCDGTDPGERSEACELALLQQALKADDVGLEELEELSAAVADPPTASLSLTDGNTAVLGFSEAVLDVSTAEPLTADTISVFLDGVPLANAVMTRRNDTVYEIDLGLDAPATGGEKLDVIIGAASIVGIRGGLVPRQRHLLPRWLF